MNKQDFQQKIKDMKPPKFFTAVTLGDAYEAGFEEAKGNALYNSGFLNEPEKPVVPQYVADMIAEKKKQKYGIVDTIKNLWAFNDPFDLVVEKQLNWIVENQEDFAKAWLYGYEIEKEKLYTVEIPNPNGDGYGRVYLGRNEDNKIELRIWNCFSSIEFSNDWKQFDNAQLTESEIKKDFAWAWKYAEEVRE